MVVLKIVKNRLSKPVFVLLVVWALVSCVDGSEFEISGVEINPELALPIAFADMSVGDLIEDADTSFVKVDDEGLVYLTYHETLETKDINSLFQPQNSTVLKSFTVPAGTIPPHAQDFRADSITSVIDLGLSPAELSKIDFKSGTLSYSASLSPANPNFQFAVNVVMPTVSHDVTHSSVNLVTSTSGNLALNPYTATLNQNKFNIKLVLIYKKTNNTVTIAPNTKVNVTVNFTSMDYASLEGFFGDQTSDFPNQTISLNALGSTLEDATISFVQPKVEIVVQNEYGVPCMIDFSTFKAIKGAASVNVLLNPANPINLQYPISPGGTAKTVITVTNAKQLLDFNPDEFYYSATAHVNQGLSAGNNFLADTSKMKISMNVEIPLYGSATNIILTDTMSIDLSDIEADKISDAQLTLKSKNELPLAAQLQLYLANDQFVVFDSLIVNYTQELVTSSNVNAGGELVTPGQADITIDIPSSKLEKLFDAKSLIVKATMNTTDEGNQDVKFKSDYRLKIDVGLRVKLKIKGS